MKKDNELIEDLFSHMKRKTERGAMYFNERIKQAQKAMDDTKKDQRIANKNCKYCFYFADSIAGQAFTDTNCSSCNTHVSWPNTNTPLFCATCSDKYHMCIHCGADLELRTQRRKLDYD